MATTTSADSNPPPFVPLPGDDDQQSIFYHTIASMVRTGHHKWGFLVYRVSYDDDAAWQRVLHIFRRVTEVRATNKGKTHLLPYLAYTPMEDRDRFEGASKDTIREYFRDWVHERSVERDGPGACPENEELTRWSPRYKACLYVDKEAMDGASIREIGFFAEPYCHVEGTGVVIDGQFGEHDRDVINRAIGGAREEFEPVEGRTGWDVGWMYFRLYLPPALYENLSMSEDEWAGSYFYKRPPGVYIGF